MSTLFEDAQSEVLETMELASCCVVSRLATPHFDVALVGIDVLDVDSTGIALRTASELGVGFCQLRQESLHP